MVKRTGTSTVKGADKGSFTPIKGSAAFNAARFNNTEGCGFLRTTPVTMPFPSIVTASTTSPSAPVCRARRG